MKVDEKVFEMSGVRASGHDKESDVWLQLCELGETVWLKETYKGAYLTVDEARKLARQLYRLARRIEKRKEAQG